MQNFKNLPTKYQIGETPWNVYPRPTLKRNSFYCLNGKWNFGVAQPENPIFDREIIVPFPPESTLSNVGEVFDESETLYYKKVFSLPDNFVKNKVLLHFGAVDQKAKVFLNGKFFAHFLMLDLVTLQRIIKAINNIIQANRNVSKLKTDKSQFMLLVEL